MIGNNNNGRTRTGWHNGTPRILYEGRHKSDHSAIVVGTPDGSAGSFTVTDVEGATYKMP